jgi:pSer/pThr/pTyr-binding forkhead associated (FHA) protein
VLQLDPASGKQWLLRRGTLLIGRGELADIVLPHESVSRIHARIHSSETGVTIEDAGSKNGTFVNDTPLSGSRELRAGDVVRVGSFELTVEPLASLGAIDPRSALLEQTRTIRPEDLAGLPDYLMPHTDPAARPGLPRPAADAPTRELEVHPADAPAPGGTAATPSATDEGADATDLEQPAAAAAEVAQPLANVEDAGWGGAILHQAATIGEQLQMLHHAVGRALEAYVEGGGSEAVSRTLHVIDAVVEDGANVHRLVELGEEAETLRKLLLAARQLFEVFSAAEAADSHDDVPDHPHPLDV